MVYLFQRQSCCYPFTSWEITISLFTTDPVGSHCNLTFLFQPTHTHTHGNTVEGMKCQLSLLGFSAVWINEGRFWFGSLYTIYSLHYLFLTAQGKRTTETRYCGVKMTQRETAYPSSLLQGRKVRYLWSKSHFETVQVLFFFLRL